MLEVSIWNLLLISLSFMDYDPIIPVLGISLLVNQAISLGGVCMHIGFIEYFKLMSLWQFVQGGRVATDA